MLSFPVHAQPSLTTGSAGPKSWSYSSHSVSCMQTFHVSCSACAHLTSVAAKLSWLVAPLSGHCVEESGYFPPQWQQLPFCLRDLLLLCFFFFKSRMIVSYLLSLTSVLYLLTNWLWKLFFVICCAPKSDWLLAVKNTSDFHISGK